MSAVKTSTLPAVLKEYLPEYEPRALSTVPGKLSQVPGDQGTSQDVGGGEEGGGDHSSLPAGDRASSPGGRSQAPRGRNTAVSDTKSMQSRDLLRSREKTMDFQRKQEIEHYQRNFDDWQQIRQEFREEKTQKYRSKISLQKELIRRQEELHQLRQREEEEELLKKREEERAYRRTQNEALQAVCRQSLEEDRRVSRHRRAPKSHTDTQSERPESSLYRKPLDLPQDGRQLTNVSQVSTVSSVAEDVRPVAHTQHVTVLQEEDEEEEEEDEFYVSDNEEEYQGKALPWHHDQLYRLYGKDADYFLHPKIDVEKPKILQPMNPKLRKQGGRAGARQLWLTLREDSRAKLLEEDTNIPSELKSAYSAFVRQLLTRRRRPVKRNYYAEEDVPDMDRLLDQSRIHAAQDYRHKVDLMYRSSRTNRDRCGVLMYNNPMPDLNNWEGGDSVQRYMPSWAEGEEQDHESVHSYKKWIKNPKNTKPIELPRLSPEGSTKQEEAEPEGSTDTWDIIREKSEARRRARPQKPKGPPPCVFLTEEAARCKGEFSQRHRDIAEAKKMPKGYGAEENGPGQFKSHSAMAMIGGQGEDMGASASQQGLNDVSSGARGGRSHSVMSTLQPWQPLSMHALSEYRDRKPAVGSGLYNQGRVPVWETSQAA